MEVRTTAIRPVAGQVIEGIEFRDIPDAAIAAWVNGAQYTAHDVTIRGCKFMRCKFGVMVHGLRWQIVDCEFDTVNYAPSGDSDYMRVLSDDCEIRNIWTHGPADFAAYMAGINNAGDHVDGIQFYSNNGESCRRLRVYDSIFEDGHQGLMMRALKAGEATDILFENCVFNNWMAWGASLKENINATFRNCVFANLPTNSVGARAHSTATFENCLLYKSDGFWADTGGSITQSGTVITEHADPVWGFPVNPVRNALGGWSGLIRHAGLIGGGVTPVVAPEPEPEPEPTPEPEPVPVPEAVDVPAGLSLIVDGPARVTVTR